MNTIEEIENLAVQCQEKDYSNPKSVKAHNSAVNKIRDLISNIKNDEEIIHLLNNKNTSSWVAFQSLEKPESLSEEVYKKAINELKNVSKDSRPESMAAEMRLEELNVKN